MSAQTPRIAFVGEAYGEQEALVGIPFFGPAGQELTKLCREAGIDRAGAFITNVLNFRPPNNDIKALCIPKAAAVAAYIERKPALAERHPEFPWPDHYHWPPLVGPGNFLHPEYLGELARLRTELASLNLDLAIALGNTACWGLLNRSGIGKLRGYVYDSTLVDRLRVLPTYHPASILRQYSNRPVMVADLRKAVRLVAGDSGDPGISAGGRTPRRLWIEPEEGDLAAWWAENVPEGHTRLAVDIETFQGTITCIGFGTLGSAISIPLWDRRKVDGNYWPDAGTEVRVLKLVQQWLLSPNPKIFQNGMYDMQYIWKTWGFKIGGQIEDTMLVHHALQPEMSKDLNFLGSVYTDEVSWKGMRKQAHMKAKAEKRDE